MRANIVFVPKPLGLTWTTNHWHSISIVCLSIIIIEPNWRNIILFIISNILFFSLKTNRHFQISLKRSCGMIKAIRMVEMFTSAKYLWSSLRLSNLLFPFLNFYIFRCRVTDILETCLFGFAREFICILSTWWQNIWNVEPVCFYFHFFFYPELYELQEKKLENWKGKNSFFICLKHS